MIPRYKDKYKELLEKYHALERELDKIRRPASPYYSFEEIKGLRFLCERPLGSSGNQFIQVEKRIDGNYKGQGLWLGKVTDKQRPEVIIDSQDAYVLRFVRTK